MISTVNGYSNGMACYSSILDKFVLPPKFNVLKHDIDRVSGDTHDEYDENRNKIPSKKSHILVIKHPSVSKEHIIKVLKTSLARKNCVPVPKNSEETFDFDQPQHLKFPKPSNTNLWKMRKSNEGFTAGYNPNRGDFTTEYDNNAEELLCLAGSLRHFSVGQEEAEHDIEEQKLLEELQISLVESYNDRLEERARRKNIIMEHGLINSIDTKSWYSNLEKSHGRQLAKKLVRLLRILKADEAEYFFALLDSVNEKRAKVNKLIHCRCQHGIPTLRGIVIFEDERKKREVVCERFDVRNIIEPTTVKKKQPYHKIFHLPRFRDLSVSEAELCSTLNIIPEFFLQTKETLIADCKKQNGMLLKRARQLVKIDVNKTRKIYDLFMEEGILWLPDKDTLAKGKSKRKMKKKGNCPKTTNPLSQRES